METLGAPDTGSDSILILLPSSASTSSDIIDGLLFCIELYNTLGYIDFDGSFEGIYEGVTKPLAPNLYYGKSLATIGVSVLIMLVLYEVIYESISDGNVLYYGKWLVFLTP